MHDACYACRVDVWCTMRVMRAESMRCTMRVMRVESMCGARFVLSV